MKKSPLDIKSLSAVKPVSLLCLLAAVLANNAMAQSQYFNTVANNGTYSWDGANWNISGSTGNTGPYTFNWTPGDFARFLNGAGDNFTVTVNATESMAGMYDDLASGTMTVADAGNNTGFLSVVPSATALDGFFAQGFLTAGGTLSITAPITGTGAIEEEAGGGHLQLFGNNTYSGGTIFSSSSTFVDYNNNNSFGTGNIGYGGTTFAIMENQGPTTVNIANNVQIFGTTGVNFIGNSATMSGNWNLGGGANTVNIRNNGVGTTQTISGIMSNTTGTVTFSGANNGIIKLTGANTYTGPTVIGSSGDTAITVMLGAANTLAHSGKITLAGGTLRLGGINQAMTGATLGLTASSSLYFDGATSLSFANSSGTAWTAGLTLDLADWVAGTTSLEFGTSASGLTSAQLAEIEFDANPLTKGSAYLDANGFVVPEPSSISLGVLGGLGGLAMFWNVRRRKG